MLPFIRTRRLDLPLAHDASGRFLAWMIALMVYLAALALAGATILSDMAGRWDAGLTGSATVQVMPLAGAPPVPQRVEAALALLRDTPGVTGVRPVSTEETARLLEPWLGQGVPVAELPLPALIDVALDGSGRAGVQVLTQRLATVPGIQVDDHATWLSDLLRLARAVELVALGVIGLVGTAGVVAVVYAVRTGLAIHREVVELLHVMGATDRYVARQFESHVLALAARGGAVGLGLALLTLLLVVWTAGDLEASLLPHVSLTPLQWLSLGLVPLAAAVLATLTARWTVLRALADMP